MNWHETNPNDPSLAPFLSAGDATDAEQHLDHLITDASPKIKSIVRSKLRVSLDQADCSRNNQDALEIIGDINALLLAQLRALKSQTSDRTINDFSGYVAVVTYHACYQYLRRIYPERWRLKNRLRYLLTHRSNLVLWENYDGDLLGGLAAQRQQTEAFNLTTASPRLHEDLQTLVPPSRRGKETPPGAVADLVAAIFQRVEGPVLLDDLVNIVADLCGIEEHVAVEGDESYRKADSAQPANAEVDVTTAMEQRVHLEQLWKEICQLPTRHRAAILLNLRDSKGRGVISLLPLTRVATIRQIASVLEFQLDEFARVWKELPWDDKKIAQHLGLTRQQVINLRYSARAKSSGRYRLEVLSAEKNKPAGRYEIRIDALREATTQDKIVDLAAALAMARTEEERAALMSKDNALLTADLERLLFNADPADPINKPDRRRAALGKITSTGELVCLGEFEMPFAITVTK